MRPETPEPDIERQVCEAASSVEVLKVLAKLPDGACAPWQPIDSILSELKPRDVFCELIREKQIESRELEEAIHELQTLLECMEAR